VYSYAICQAATNFFQLRINRRVQVAVLGLEQQCSRPKLLIRDDLNTLIRATAFQNGPHEIPMHRVGPDTADIAGLDAIHGCFDQSLHGLRIDRHLTMKNAARDGNGEFDQLLFLFFSRGVLRPGEVGHDFLEAVGERLDLRLMLS
jgi:hypothetical protein